VLAIVIAMTTVLHYGKYDMRIVYWPSRYSSTGTPITLAQAPAFFVEWFERGFDNMIYGAKNDFAVDRIGSMVPLLMLVQRLTPSQVPYLEGETYAYVPRLLVPRFIDPDKPSKQATLWLLNVRYGLRSDEQEDETSIGWGILTEAYANFGYVGIVGVALLFGIGCGWIQAKSDGAPILSLPALAAIVVMLRLTDMEQDMTGLASSMFQGLVVVWALCLFVRLISNRQNRVARHI
jgi:hypothetical protein